MPLSVAVSNGEGRITQFAQGRWLDGRPVTPANPFYAASLAKQVTGAAIAVLVNGGRLDPGERLGAFMPNLPEWLRDATLLQVLRHLAGLPPAGQLEGQVFDQHWTSDRAVAALHNITPPVGPPGTRFCYSNVGYILLARVVEHASGQDFASFAQQALFGPLALTEITLPATDDELGFPQVAGMGPSLPLSRGDGGLWTTARGFAQWLEGQNRDTLGIAHLVETPGRLADGSFVDYGWGIGLRMYRGEALFSHGGSWRGACCKALRSRARDVSVAVFAASHAEQDNIGRLVETILDASP